MKKLLGIVVLSLLLTNNVHSETVTLKCITTRKEVNGKENNIITGEPNKLNEKVQFIEIDPKDKNAFQNELLLGYVYFFKGAALSDKNSYITYETINRFDLTREEKTAEIDDAIVSDYKKLWEKDKSYEAFNEIVKLVSSHYINISFSKNTDKLAYAQEYECEKVVKQL